MNDLAKEFVFAQDQRDDQRQIDVVRIDCRRRRSFRLLAAVEGLGHRQNLKKEGKKEMNGKKTARTESRRGGQGANELLQVDSGEKVVPKSDVAVEE